MSDNASNITKLNASGRGKLWRVVLLFAAVLFVVAALVLFLFAEELDLDAMGRRLRYGRVEGRSAYGSFTYEPHSSNRFSRFGDGVAVASVVGLETYGENGSAALHVDDIMEESALTEGEELLLHFDVGGASLSLIHPKNGRLLQLTSDSGFYDADLSSGDTLCTAAAESGYKTVLRVYNDEQKEVYRWFSASRFMPLCAVSPDAKAAAAVSVGQTGGTFESTLFFFSTREAEPVASVSLGDELVYDIRFTRKDTLCAVTENRICWFAADGEMTGECELLSGYLSEFDLSGDGFALLKLNLFQTGDQASVITVNEKGEELGSFHSSEEILDISACGKYAAVLTARKLTIFRRDMTVYAECTNPGGATQVLVRPNGTAFLLSDGAGQLFIP